MNPTIENLPCGYLQFSEDGIITAANASMVALLDIPKQSLEGQSLQLILPKAGQIFFQSHMFPQFKIKGEINECYFKLRKVNGERVPILSNISCHQQPDGTYVYSAVIMHVQKRHSLEDALVKAKITTDKAIRALEKSNETLSRFANMVAHDLKAPMRHIKHLSSFIREDYAHLLGEDGNDMLDKLGSTANRAIHFIEKLLEYGKLNSESGRLKPVNLQTVIDTACDTLSDVITATAATIQVEPLPVVMGIESQLVQLFQNLISNALKYSQPGIPPVVTIYAVKANDTEWEVSVKDNGVGIPVKYQANVFDIMYRLHGSDHEGAGIGLATCQWIVRNHKGTIGVSSTGNDGSRFYFTLLPSKDTPKSL